MSIKEKWPLSLIVAGLFNLILLSWALFWGEPSKAALPRIALPLFCLLGVLGRRTWARKICLIQYFLMGFFSVGLIWALGLPYKAMSILQMTILSLGVAGLFLALIWSLNRSEAAKAFPGTVGERTGSAGGSG